MAPRTGFKTNQMRLAEAKELERAAQRELIACSPAQAGLLNTLLKGVYATSLGDLVGIVGITPYHMPGPLFKMGITAHHVDNAIDFGQKDTRGDIEGIKGLLGLTEEGGENQEEEPILLGIRGNPQIRPTGRTAAPATGAPTAQKPVSQTPAAKTGASLSQILVNFDIDSMASTAMKVIKQAYVDDQMHDEEFHAAKRALQAEARSIEEALNAFLTRVKAYERLCTEPIKFVEIAVEEAQKGTG